LSGTDHDHGHTYGHDHGHDHGHVHGHDHGHDHAHGQAAGTTAPPLAPRVDALVARLERLGITTEAELTQTLERFLDAAGPSNGARLVARAWVEPAFKALLLGDANVAIAQLGLDLSHWAPVRLRAVENTPRVHNVIVCTLCSCYPIALLGPSPGWYKSEAYRSRVVREPRAVLRDFGCSVADDVTIKVWDSTAELRYLVIPQRPAGTGGYDESRLAACVTRDALIGVAVAVAVAESGTPANPC
jgi:nitrile hydratase